MDARASSIEGLWARSAGRMGVRTCTGRGISVGMEISWAYSSSVFPILQRTDANSTMRFTRGGKPVVSVSRTARGIGGRRTTRRILRFIFPRLLLFLFLPGIFLSFFFDLRRADFLSPEFRKFRFERGEVLVVVHVEFVAGEVRGEADILPLAADGHGTLGLLDEDRGAPLDPAPLLVEALLVVHDDHRGNRGGLEGGGDQADGILAPFDHVDALAAEFLHYRLDAHALLADAQIG